MWTAAVLVLLAGCATPVPAPTITPSILPPPSATPVSTRLPRPPASLTQTPAPPKMRTIQLNQSVDTVYVPGGVREEYVFYSDRARWISIGLTARDGKGGLRLVVQLYDSTGALMPKVNAPVGQPSLRDVWNIPEPGQYTIRLFGTETSARAFDLGVFSVPVPDIGGGQLACNETRSGEISVHGQRDQWSFEGRIGDRIFVSMLAAGGESMLELYEPDGDLIAHSDGTIYAGPLLDTTLSSEGTHTIVVRMYGDAYAGVYRLALTCEPLDD